MVEKEDDIRCGSATVNAGLLLASDLTAMTLEERSQRLAKLQVKKIIYNQPLSSTQVFLTKDEATDSEVIKKVIVKEKLMTKESWVFAQNECNIHEMVSNHNNVVKLYDQAETETEFQMYMEYCDKGDHLSDKILERHTPVNNNQKLLSYAEDILNGLDYVHQRGVIHADIKLENVLQQSAEREDEFPMAKLCDFGLSHEMKDGKVQFNQKAGTMGYMAPELGHTEFIDPAIDMWSFGVVLYELSTAYKPTAVKNYRYGAGPIPFRAVDWRKRDKSLQDLIVSCLEMDPAKRILPNEALMHPWFTEETD